MKKIKLDFKLAFAILAFAFSSSASPRTIPVQMGETWELEGQVSAQINKEEFQRQLSDEINHVPYSPHDTLDHFSWAGNKFKFLMHYTHYGVITLVKVSSGNVSWEIDAAHKFNGSPIK